MRYAARVPLQELTEATIAAPVYSGLITYYIEGPVSERHHLMEEILTKPRFHDQTREDW